MMQLQCNALKKRLATDEILIKFCRGNAPRLNAMLSFEAAVQIEGVSSILFTPCAEYNAGV